jgi:hypothetical protein
MSRPYHKHDGGKNFFITVLLLIVAGFCYYNFSYLLKDVGKTKTATSTPVTATTHTTTVTPNDNTTSGVNDAYDIAASTFPVVGTIGHNASGELRIVPLHGITTIQYEHLKFTTEPGLHIYLSKDTTDKDFIDLGPIKGSSGTISYTIPESATPDYRFVLTWSTKSHTLFNFVEIPQNPI